MQKSGLLPTDLPEGTRDGCPGHDRAEAANGHLSCPMVLQLRRCVRYEDSPQTGTPPIRKESPADGRGLLRVTEGIERLLICLAQQCLAA